MATTRTSSRRCRAADPRYCSTHGDPALRPTAAKVTPEDTFAAAMSKLPAYARMEAQILYTKRRMQELADRYELSQVQPAADYAPISDGDPTLTSMNEEYGVFEASLTEEEKAALLSYSAAMYGPLNQYLYDKVSWAERFKGDPERTEAAEQRNLEDVRHIDSALAKHEGVERQLFRVIQPDMTRGEIPSGEEYAIAEGFVVGQNITLPAYSSTSIDPAFIHRFTSEDEQHATVVLVFNTKKGTPIGRTAETRDQAHFTQDSEREFLLPRNTEWRVSKVSRARFHARDTEDAPIEPVTVYLEEAD